MFEEAADFIRQVALIFGQAIPAVVVIERPPAPDTFSKLWPVISAVAAAATAIWAGLSWYVSSQLTAIERHRYAREKAHFILYRDPEDNNFFSGGRLFNDGNSATTIISAHVESMERVQVDTIKVKIGLTENQSKIINPGNSVPVEFVLNNVMRTRMHGFKGKCFLVINAIHQNDPIYIETLMHDINPNP